MIVGSYSIEAGRPLSPRMRDVLRSAGAGRGVTETALELRLSTGTVRTIRAAAIARLGVSNVTAAVVEAAKRGEL
jgi:DNA-binding NarL/FixJ family response regulator